MTAHKMSQAQAISVHDLMKQHCETTNGYAFYAEGWDDERVHRECFNPEARRPISLGAVANLRRRMFGKIRVPGERSTRSPGRIEALEKRVEELSQEIARLCEDVRRWQAGVDAWLQKRHGYAAPPGRPVSTPPDQLGVVNGSGSGKRA